MNMLMEGDIVPYVLKALIFLITSFVLLKLLGKRAFSEMTIIEAVVMISLGTLLVNPLKSENSWLVGYGGL
ncbi:hypothetical protein [Lederbergia citrea]|uniref:Uncharacterized protein n=1 Tax=Lederbergia citrea TaxID=2833581 RepID=A0A942Z433_9BACI|nr:hypothetical protein [Lederbergia citrea]MBS4222057.1 hypothetical protein [Lederbergia citrea]